MPSSPALMVDNGAGESRTIKVRLPGAAAAATDARLLRRLKGFG